jgi:hypothetical protein
MIRDDIIAAWLSLSGADGPPDGLRLLPLDVMAPAGAVCAGRDAVGDVHLLVPVPPGSPVSADQRSEVVEVVERELLVGGKRQLFVDLACRSRDLDDVFERLAVEVCEHIAETPEKALTVPGRVLSRWRQLLEMRLRALGANQTAGLFGELHVLEQTVLADPARRVDHWQSDPRAVHDLRRGNVAIEVKTTTARTGRVVEIHGLTQLEPPESGTLYLAFLRIEKSPRGRTIDEVLARLTDQGADGARIAGVAASVGFTAGDPASTRFVVSEERWYRVDPAFPRIVPQTLISGHLPDGVTKINYSADLGGSSPLPLSDDERAQVLEGLAAE